MSWSIKAQKEDFSSKFHSPSQWHSKDFLCYFNADLLFGHWATEPSSTWCKCLIYFSYYIQFSFQDNVQDMRQVVLDRSESCYRTCFSLWHDGVRLDDFAELHMIEGLKENSIIKVVEGILKLYQENSDTLKFGINIHIYCSFKSSWPLAKFHWFETSLMLCFDSWHVRFFEHRTC